MFKDLAYTDDGCAVYCDNDGLFLTSAFEIIDLSQIASNVLFEDLEYIQSWMHEARAFLPENLMIKFDDGADFAIVRTMNGTLDEFIQKMKSYGDFVAFKSVPKLKVVGWKVSTGREIDEAMCNFFQAKRMQALKSCVKAGDPLSLFPKAS